MAPRNGIFAASSGWAHSTLAKIGRHPSKQAQLEKWLHTVAYLPQGQRVGRLSGPTSPTRTADGHASQVLLPTHSFFRPFAAWRASAVACFFCCRNFRIRSTRVWPRTSMGKKTCKTLGGTWYLGIELWIDLLLLEHDGGRI